MGPLNPAAAKYSEFGSSSSFLVPFLIRHQGPTYKLILQSELELTKYFHSKKTTTTIGINAEEGGRGGVGCGEGRWG